MDHIDARNEKQDNIETAKELEELALILEAEISKSDATKINLDSL